MSSSAILAAKKRLENNIRNYNIPTDEQPSTDDQTAESQKSHVLHLALLQSRLRWTTSVFVKYRHDPVKQPRRSNNSRKKWPNMRYVGTCTVQLGPHYFPETSFYEAIRIESWTDIAQAAGIQLSGNNDVLSNTSPENQQNTAPPAVIAQANAQQPGDIFAPFVPYTVPNGASPTHELVFRDLVMEFKANPGERFLFPKDVILEMPTVHPPFEILASFLLPLDTEAGDEFFKDPKEKLELWGDQCDIAAIRDFASKSSAKDTQNITKPSKPYQPANIRLKDVDANLFHALITTVNKPEIVREKMIAKMQTIPKRTFLRYNATSDPAIQDLLQKAYTVPEVLSGPVLAEKRRNEMLNAVQLGKRPRSEKDEEAKSKNANSKDDGLRKCLYCSTKHTAMWRPGPAGSGTLCNACGLLWSQGKILKGAPVISKEEEKRLAKEQRIRDRELQLERERQEQERQEEESQKEKERQRKKAESESSKMNRNSFGYYAAQVLQRQQTGQSILLQRPTTATDQPFAIQVAPSPQSFQPPISFAPTVPGPPPQPIFVHMPPTPYQQGRSDPVPPAQPTPPKRPVSTTTSQSSLFSSAGVPLPTLSIQFTTPSLLFVHPHCGVTLVGDKFAIRLTKDGSNATMDISKRLLQNTKFEVVKEEPSKREVLIMKCVLGGGEPINRFGIDLLVPNDESHSMSIRFLEKLDPNGGAVVQRILERWLVTFSSS